MPEFFTRGTGLMCLVHIFFDLLAVQGHSDFLRVPFLVSNDQVADIGTWLLNFERSFDNIILGHFSDFTLKSLHVMQWDMLRRLDHRCGIRVDFDFDWWALEFASLCREEGRKLTDELLHVGIYFCLGFSA